MAEFHAAIDSGRPFGNVAFSPQNALGIIAAIAFPATFRHDPEVPEEGAAAAAVLADPAVNGLEADGEQAMVLEVPGDLLRAPLELQELIDEVPALGRVVGPPSLPAAPGGRIGVSLKGRIPALLGPLIAPKLSIDGTWSPA